VRRTAILTCSFLVAIPFLSLACGGDSKGEDLFRGGTAPGVGGSGVSGGSGGSAGTGGAAGTGGNTGGSGAVGGSGGAGGDGGSGAVGGSGGAGGDGGSGAVGGSGGAGGDGGSGAVGGSGGVGGDGGSGAVGGSGGVGGDGGSGAVGGSGGAGGDGGTAGACVPIGHDEDGDEVDDGCDNCPTYDNADQANSDADGVGDACEEPVDESLLSHIQYFEPWVSGAVSAQWAFDPKFELSPDVLNVDDKYCGTSCGENAFLKVTLQPVYSVETTLTLGPNMDGWVGLLFAHEPQTGSTWECVLYRSQYARNIELWYRKQYGNGFTRVAYETNVEDANEPPTTQRKIRVYADGSTFWCEFENASGAYAVVESPTSTTPDLSGQAGLRAYRAVAHFQSFVLYE